MVIAVGSYCRVHGRAADPDALVLAGGLVLFREVGRLGRHRRLEPVDGNGIVVIAVGSYCRVHGRAAGPVALLLAGGLVLFREVGGLARHRRLEPVDGNGLKSSLL